MKSLLSCVCCLIMMFVFSCDYRTDLPPAKDGVFIHVSHGPNHPQRVLMAFQMAQLMSESKDVLMYFDIKGIEVLLKEAPDVIFKQFPGSKEQLARLSGKVTIMACPGCLRAAEKSPEDLIAGVRIADKEEFFSFTDGRILTLDY